MESQPSSMRRVRFSAPRRRVAEALEKEGGEAAELAHHYPRAGAWRPALESLLRAAREAEEAYAWDAP